MKKLVVDIGNTATKSAIFDGTEMNGFVVWQKEKDLIAYVAKSGIEKMMVSSVAGNDVSFLSKIPQNISASVLSPETPLPIELHYRTVETLGVDRIAGVMGAYSMFPGENCLIIDIGTCITYDFLSDENIYFGGAISPGLEMRLKSLHKFTGKLPRIQLGNEPVIPPITGDSTRTSILSGVVNGMWMEMSGFIHHYEKKSQNINTIITGGDSYRFESLINPHIFVAPKLVLQGLNCILDYNERED